MRFALPVRPDGRLNPHFGRSPAFTFIDADPEAKQITGRQTLPAPPHDHAALARFMEENGAEVVIAGGMGPGMRHTLERAGLTVVVGAPSLDPAELVTQYLNGTLVTGENTCGHHHGHGHGYHGHHDHDGHYDRHGHHDHDGHHDRRGHHHQDGHHNQHRHHGEHDPGDHRGYQGRHGRS